VLGWLRWSDVLGVADRKKGEEIMSDAIRGEEEGGVHSWLPARNNGDEEDECAVQTMRGAGHV
jgi:hypothetical protein